MMDISRISQLTVANKAQLLRGIWVPFNTVDNKTRRATLGDILETASNGIIALRANISNIELQTGFSAPIELMPAQGAGKIIEVTNASLYTHYSGAAFATNTSIELKCAGATKSQFNSANALAATQTGGRIFRHTVANAAADTQLLANTALQFAIEDGDPTAGGATRIDLFILLRVNIL